jgi:hypothetical protein
MVQGPDEGFDFVPALGEKVHHLTLRVCPRVGATGTPNPDILSGELPQCPFNSALHRGGLSLNLKSPIPGSVVLHHQGDTPD